MLKIIVSTIIIVGAMLTPALAEKAAPETKVYTSNAYGDSSYHKKYCSIVTSGFGTNTMTLQAAIDKRKTPCKKCNPPTGLTHRQAKTKTTTASLNPKVKAYRTGDSAADFERDPDGTVIGRGGGGLSIISKIAFNPTRNRVLTPYESDQNYKILDIDTKTTRGKYQFDTVSIRVTVRNLSKTSRAVNMPLQAIDRDGFEVEFMFVSCTLPANEVTRCTSTTMIKKPAAKRISRWQAK
jgi:hypothetical protein